MCQTWIIIPRKTLRPPTRSAAFKKICVIDFEPPFAVVEIYRLQKDADDCREARTHPRDRRSIYPRAFHLLLLLMRFSL